jgi:hypothetical protein
MLLFDHDDNLTILSSCRQYCRDMSDKSVKSSSRYDSLNAFYKLMDRFKKGHNINESTTPSSSSLDSRNTNSSPSMGKTAYRGTYNCSKCRLPKMRGHVCPMMTVPRDCIIPREEAISPATVLFNALQGIHKPKARVLQSTAHLLPIINHSGTSSSLNHSSEAPPHDLSTTEHEPVVPFSHVSCHGNYWSYHLRHHII